ncbi:MAG TPA: hypothetical protein VHE77_10775 [Dongiaceae bacterium]|jgi:hypothetical protein|nr:hypothetical protein [Dongiaceae bacterium]
MRFFGESRSRAHAPADKPRDAEAMDIAAARAVDAEAARRRAEAGSKPKQQQPVEWDAAEAARAAQGRLINRR